VSKPLARELLAAAAKIFPPPRSAAPDFAGDALRRALICATTWASISATQKRMTQSAIHTARRDQRRGA